MDVYRMFGIYTAKQDTLRAIYSRFNINHEYAKLVPKGARALSR